MIVPLPEWIQRKGSGVPDVCIIGAGPVGLDLAVQLARVRRTVLVLESGGSAPDPRVQKLGIVRETGRSLTSHAREQIRPGLARFLEAGSVRALGGSSRTWLGCWKLPDRIDLEPRDWIGGPGWPLRWDEIEPHADAVMRDYGVPRHLLLAPPSETARTGIQTTLHFVQTPPVDFAGKHRAELASSRQATVVLGANVAELLPAPGATRVGEVLAKGFGGLSERVAAGSFVLAAGAVETARLLLNSTRFGRQGLGNQHGQVGRGFLDHLQAQLGLLHPDRSAESAGLLGHHALQRRKVAVSWTLPPARQRALAIANHAVGLRPVEPRAGWPARLFRAPPPHELFLHIEQLPNPTSRVVLDDERDELGINLACVHWELGAGDEVGVRKFVTTIIDLLTPRYGKLIIDDEALSSKRWKGSGHPMGTARMAADPHDGVVDSDCQVFGIENLYVVGTAAFPVAGNADPLLLALALARRLARRAAAGQALPVG